jgi:dipeptidase E
MKIIAIGGGEIGRPGYPIETRKIDREIIRLTGKKHPKALLLPTASGDSPLYWQTFKKYYGQKLGCKTNVLWLTKGKLLPKETKKMILDSDIIYVGGGNTLKMLKIWRKLGVDKILEDAGKKGVVLSGVSAGAICWFKYGNSDSGKFGPRKSKKLIKVRGIELLPLIACPHYDIEKFRRPSLIRMIKKNGGLSIALENCSALEVVDNQYRIIISSKKAHAFRLYRCNGKVVEEKLPSDQKFRPLKELFVI